MRTHSDLTALVLAAALFAAASSAWAAGSVPPLRCRWKDPVTLGPLDLSFAGNAMVVVPPGENLVVSAGGPAGDGRVALIRDGRPFREGESLTLAAPADPGAYYMSFLVSAGGGSRACELCVFVPYRATGKRAGKGVDVYVRGKAVGNYRDVAHSGNDKVRNNPGSYKPPVWWIGMTPDNERFEVVPRVAVGDLVAFTEDTGLRHTDLIPVNYAMWTAIETLRLALDTKGIPGSALKLISVFRTPAYNRSVGSNSFGRHIYGDAFDFYIDLNGDGKASDLDGDGKVDRRDAYLVIALVEDLQKRGLLPMGGEGIYHTVGGDHGLTMHLDARGHRATWCYLYSGGGTSEFSWASRSFPELDRADEEAAAARAAKAGKPYRRPRREPLPAD